MANPTEESSSMHTDEGKSPLLSDSEFRSQDNGYNERQEGEFGARPSLRKGLSIFVTVFLAVIIGLVSGATVIAFAGKTDHNNELDRSATMPMSDHITDWLTCGETPEQARAHGCKFDLMLGSWIPEPCHTPDMMEETLKSIKFPWYRDPEMKSDPVSEEEVRRGEWTVLYHERIVHMIHCMYVWKVQHHSWSKFLPVDSESWTFKHTEHCAKVMLDPNMQWTQNFTRNILGYSSCGRPCHSS